MYRRTFQDQDEGSFLLDVLKIFIGVFLGGLAAAFTYEAVVEWRIEQAAKKAMTEFQRQMDKTNADMERQRRAEEKARTQAEEEAARKRSALALVDRLERERKARKDAAWAQFYKPSPNCQVDSGTHACANEYMAARKRFESAYVDR